MRNDYGFKQQRYRATLDTHIYEDVRRTIAKYNKSKNKIKCNSNIGTMFKKDITVKNYYQLTTEKYYTRQKSLLSLCVWLRTCYDIRSTKSKILTFVIHVQTQFMQQQVSILSNTSKLCTIAVHSNYNCHKQLNYVKMSLEEIYSSHFFIRELKV